MKITKTIYWISTTLFSLIMLFSAGNYFFNHEMIAGFFELFGYPTYLIYPLAIAKILGLIAVISNLSAFLKHLAYAGFFFNVVLAFTAHAMAGDSVLFTVIAMALLVTSFMMYRRMY